MSEQNQSSYGEQWAGNTQGIKPLSPEQADAMRKQAIAHCMKKYGVPQISKEQFERMTPEQKQEYRRRYAAAQEATKPMLEKIATAVSLYEQAQRAAAAPTSGRMDFGTTRQDMPARAFADDIDEDEAPRRSKSKKDKTGKAKREKPAKTAKQKKGRADVDETDGKPRKKKNGKKIAIIASIAAAVVLVAGGLFVLMQMGYIDILPEKYNTYEVSNNETLIKYLKHPSLRAGDTLNLGSSFTVDVDEVFGGYAILPLVNYGGSGSVEFTGGTVVLAGGVDACTMDNARFSGSTLYIDAPATSISWQNAPGDAKINAKSLNGTAHLGALDLLCVGAKTTIPVTIKNVSGGSLTDAQVSFTSASCVFPEGETYIIPDIAADSGVTFNVPVILTEAGRIQIVAYGTDANGKTTLLGSSDYLNVAGDGYYAGDTHTHTTESIFDRQGTMDANITNAYDHGMSFMYSVENRHSEEEDAQRAYDRALIAQAEEAKRKKEEAARKAEEEAAAEEAEAEGEGATPAEGTSTRGSFRLPTMLEEGDMDVVDIDTMTDSEILQEIKERGAEYIAERVDQSRVDSLTGSTNAFLQIPAIETGRISRHMLVYGATVASSSGYGNVSPYTTQHNATGQWIYQDAIDEVTEAGGIVVLPHIVKDGDITENMSNAKSITGMTAIEYISANGMTSENTESKVEYNLWNNYNTQGFQRVFVIMSSNNYISEDVGLQFIKGHMPSLTEENCNDLLRSGEFIASNGPDVRFTLGGHVMGSEITLAEETGTKAKARFYVSDDSPLTSVTLYRYDLTGRMENLEPVIEFSEDFTGKGVYSYTGDIELELNIDCYYRVEVRSERSNKGNDVGIGLSNPIWVARSTSLKNTTMLQTLNMKFGGEVKQAPNGTYYIDADRFKQSMLEIETDGKYTDVAYHKYNSELMADKVTVLITASDTTQWTETIYIV